jgi:hypothetical protein
MRHQHVRWAAPETSPGNAPRGRRWSLWAGLALAWALSVAWPGGARGGFLVSNISNNFNNGTVSQVGNGGGAATTFATGFDQPRAIVFVPQAAVPEPTSAALMGVGVAVALGVARRLGSGPDAPGDKRSAGRVGGSRGRRAGPRHDSSWRRRQKTSNGGSWVSLDTREGMLGGERTRAPAPSGPGPRRRANPSDRLPFAFARLRAARGREAGPQTDPRPNGGGGGFVAPADGSMAISRPESDRLHWTADRLRSEPRRGGRSWPPRPDVPIARNCIDSSAPTSPTKMPRTSMAT